MEAMDGGFRERKRGFLRCWSCVGVVRSLVSGDAGRERSGAKLGDKDDSTVASKATN